MLPITSLCAPLWLCRISYFITAGGSCAWALAMKTPLWSPATRRTDSSFGLSPERTSQLKYTLLLLNFWTKKIIYFYMWNYCCWKDLNIIKWYASSTCIENTCTIKLKKQNKKNKAPSGSILKLYRKTSSEDFWTINVSQMFFLSMLKGFLSLLKGSNKNRGLQILLWFLSEVGLTCTF